MGQNNSRRISHTLEAPLRPNVFRDDQLRQIINDLSEEDSGVGFSEIIRSGAFVTKITIWDRPTNNPTPDVDAIKRTETVFNRTGAFIDTIVKTVFSEDGVAAVATTTATVTRDGSNRAAFIEVVNVIL